MANIKSDPDQKKETESILNNYILQDKIGSGSFSKVYRIIEKGTNKIYAAKISLNAIREETYDLFKNISREVNIISKLNHPSILKFLFYSPFNFKGKTKPVIITEYASNGSLSKLIEHDRLQPNNPILNDTRKLIIIYGIASAMSYLHSHNFLHRDLKPDNILLDDFLLPKVADFGLSKMSQSSNGFSFMKTTVEAIKGTPMYIAPEIWSNCEYSKSSDVFAFAIVVYEIMTLKRPFSDIDIYSLSMRVQKAERPKFDTEVPETYKYLIERCWLQNPENRPSFDQILIELKNDHNYITKNVDEAEFLNYAKLINEYKISLDSSKEVVSMDSFMKLYFPSKKINVNLNVDHSNFSFISKSFPYKYLKCLGQESMILVKDAESGDSEKMFEIGRNLIEGRLDFPIDVQIGLIFLKNSIKKGNKNSLVYYIKMLIKGDFIPKNHKKAVNLLGDLIEDTSMHSFLYGMLCNNEKKYNEAAEYFKSSINAGNSDALYKYA